MLKLTIFSNDRKFGCRVYEALISLGTDTSVDRFEITGEKWESCVCLEGKMTPIKFLGWIARQKKIEFRI